MKINLYQLICEIDYDELLFRELSKFKQSYGEEFPAHLYETVFSGDIDATNNEDVFRIFNCNFPHDYKGRSMSVSDVLEVITPDGKSKFFFVNRVGFSEIDFDKNKAMGRIINHNFDKCLYIKEKVNVFYAGNMGIERISCAKMILRRCMYSQCQLGYKLFYWDILDGKPMSKQFLEKTLFVVTKCNLKMPDNILYEVKNGLKKSKYPSNSLDALGAVSTWILKSGFTFENL